MFGDQMRSVSLIVLVASMNVSMYLIASKGYLRGYGGTGGDAGMETGLKDSGFQVVHGPVQYLEFQKHQSLVQTSQRNVDEREREKEDVNSEKGSKNSSQGIEQEVAGGIGGEARGLPTNAAGRAQVASIFAGTSLNSALKKGEWTEVKPWSAKHPAAKLKAYLTANGFERTTLYHGTTCGTAVLGKILTGGFLYASKAWLGPGIYFANENHAKRYGKGAQGQGFLIMADVFIPKTSTANFVTIVKSTYVVKDPLLIFPLAVQVIDQSATKGIARQKNIAEGTYVETCPPRGK